MQNMKKNILQITQTTNQKLKGVPTYPAIPRAYLFDGLHTAMMMWYVAQVGFSDDAKSLLHMITRLYGANNYPINTTIKKLLRDNFGMTLIS